MQKRVASRYYFVQDIVEPVEEIHLGGIMYTFVSVSIVCICIKSVLQSGIIIAKFVTRTSHAFVSNLSHNQELLSPNL